jgi:hypothetical protein
MSGLIGIISEEPSFSLKHFQLLRYHVSRVSFGYSIEIKKKKKKSHSDSKDKKKIKHKRIWK